MSMPKGKCPRCGAEYTGWALSNPEHRKCDKCGADLVMTNEEKTKVVNDKPPRENALFSILWRLVC